MSSSGSVHPPVDTFRGDKTGSGSQAVSYTCCALTSSECVSFSLSKSTSLYHFSAHLLNHQWAMELIQSMFLYHPVRLIYCLKPLKLGNSRKLMACLALDPGSTQFSLHWKAKWAVTTVRSSSLSASSSRKSHSCGLKCNCYCLSHGFPPEGGILSSRKCGVSEHAPIVSP